MNPEKDLSTEAVIKMVVMQAQEKKAEDLLILNLSDVTSFTDYFLLMTVESTKQAQAVCDAIVDNLKKSRNKPLSREGYMPGNWILVDYVDFIVHIFLPDTRSFYALERLWGDAPDVTEHFLS